MILDNTQVPKIGLQRHVEHIANNRDATANHFDAGIGQHLNQLPFWNAELVRLVDDIKRDSAQHCIATNRKQSNYAVKSEAEPGSRQAECTVDNPRNAPETCETRSWRDVSAELVRVSLRQGNTPVAPYVSSRRAEFNPGIVKASVRLYRGQMLSIRT